MRSASIIRATSSIYGSGIRNNLITPEQAKAIKPSLVPFCFRHLPGLEPALADGAYIFVVIFGVHGGGDLDLIAAGAADDLADIAAAAGYIFGFLLVKDFLFFGHDVTLLQTDFDFALVPACKYILPIFLSQNCHTVNEKNGSSSRLSVKSF